MLTLESKTGQHNGRLLPRKEESSGMPVPYLSHSIEDILKRPSCLAERKMQKIEENLSENARKPNEKEELKSIQYTGANFLKLYYIFLYFSPPVNLFIHLFF